MHAVFLAASMSRPIGGLTSSNIQCMAKINGVTLIERILRSVTISLTTKLWV